jgi:hypothetical protein
MRREDTGTYLRYPLANMVIYNGATLLHYLLGAVGLALGYQGSPAAYGIAIVYLLFSLTQMYLLMPLLVCPNCVYYTLDESRCVTGLNAFSKKITKRGNIKDFPDRGRGIFCHNNLYMVALIFPIIGVVPALVFNFSVALLLMLLALIALLLFRIFVIFAKLACVYCSAKNICPNAQSMGIGST